MEGEVGVGLLKHLLQLCLSEFAIYLGTFRTGLVYINVDLPEPAKPISNSL
jgi:hypothetical protein